MNSNYQDAITKLQTQWWQADLDDRTYLGDPDLWGTLYPSGTVRKKMYNFNLTHSSVMMVTGHQRKNRKSTICIPRRSPVQKTADQFTKCLNYVHSNGGYEVYSVAFEHGSIVQGFGLTSIFPDYADDPVSPEIKLRFVDFRSVLIDPYFRNKDLSDCRFIWTRQYFSKEEAKLLYPDHAEEIENTPYGGSPKDDKFYYMPENQGLETNKLIAFDEYWYLAQREATYIIDTTTQETKEIFGDEEDLRIVLMQLGERVKIVKKPKQSVRRAILVNGRVLIDEMRPYGIDRYPFVGFYGNFNPNTQYYGYKFKGIVRDMRDAQFLFNYRKVTDLDILDSQQQGIKVKKGALLTPDDTLNRGNGRVLVVNDKMQMDDVQPMQIIPPSPVMMQMEDMLKSVMREISGINEELLGAAEDDKAGVLAMLRASSGLVTLQKYFDQLDESQQECGDIIIQMIQHFWSYGKVKAVIGEEPTPEFDDKAFFTYGAKIVQGALTDTQQQLELAQLFELQQRFGEIFPPDEIIEAMTIQNKDRILEKMAKAQEQQQQQEQAMAEMQMQQSRVDMEKNMAQVESEKALAQERQEKSQTEYIDRIKKMSESDAEKERALLDLIKSLSELQDMDLNQIQKKVEIINMLQPMVEQPSTEEQIANPQI